MGLKKHSASTTVSHFSPSITYILYLTEVIKPDRIPVWNAL